MLKIILIVLVTSPLIHSRPFGLTETETHLLIGILKEALSRHQIPTDKEISFSGNFECSPPDVCSVALDVNLSNSQTENGVLSGNDVLNGIGNGNGNDNGNNGNNNGNVILQIFNIPPDEVTKETSTTVARTTYPWN